MNEIVTTQPGEESALTVAEPHTWLNFLAHAVRDPSIEVSKLEALRRMQREDIAEDARLRFNQARTVAQSEMLPILRTEKNTATNSKYAPLEAIDAVIRPIYTRHGFSMDFDSIPIEGGVRVICEVSHDAGHVKTRSLEGALDIFGPRGSANKTPIQALVSSTTYLRRTLTCFVWNLTMFTEDTDGNRVRRTEETGELAGRTQADELYRLLGECSPNGVADEAAERRFFDLMRQGDKRLADVTSLKAVPAALFVIVRNALLTKKHNILQRAALKAKHEMKGVT